MTIIYQEDILNIISQVVVPKALYSVLEEFLGDFLEC